MGEIFATTSGKGGVGKSSVAVGLGFAFASLGKTVLLVDMDAGLRCLDLLLGIDSLAVLDLGDAVKSGNIEDTAYPCSKEKLFCLPAPESFDGVDSADVTSLAEKAAEIYDIVIFDFPAGIDTSLYTALPPKTLFLGVATPDPVSVRDIAAMSNRLSEIGLKSRLIINRFDYKQHKKRRLSGIDGIIDTAALQLLGIIPEAQDINTLSLKHRLKTHSNASNAFLRIAQRLMHKNIPLKKLKKI